MTYIKWKDEVESYLVNLSQEEKQKIFSYFSEMYADKRDAGESEEQIIEEFGAPYDVAKKILAESRDAATSQEGDAAGVSGGNNYNYNYYNYNYGGAPQNTASQSAPPSGGKRLHAENAPKPAPTPAPPPAAERQQPKKQLNAARLIVGIILTILLIGFSVTLVGSAIGLTVEGFIVIGFTSGALAASNCVAADGTAMIGWGMMMSGLGILLLAPFGALCGFLWRKLRAFLKGV